MQVISCRCQATILFDNETTAQNHCQMGRYAIASETLLDWIEENS